jgi:hypothetical protein
MCAYLGGDGLCFAAARQGWLFSLFVASDLSATDISPPAEILGR